mgnify:CR=1 FL=1
MEDVENLHILLPGLLRRRRKLFRVKEEGEEKKVLLRPQAFMETKFMVKPKKNTERRV